MIFQRVTVRPLRLMSGCSAGLVEKTALCELQFELNPVNWAQVETSVRQHLQAFAPVEGLRLEPPQHWPAFYLMIDAKGTSQSAAPLAHASPLGAWVVALVIALQQWARDPVWRGRVLEAKGTSLSLAIPWQREDVFKAALSWALRLFAAWSAGENAFDEQRAVEAQVRAWLIKVQQGGLLPNTIRFAQAAAKRGIPCATMPGFIQLGWGKHADRMDSSFTARTSSLATRIARNKFITSQVLAEAGLPVPPSAMVGDVDQALKVADKLGWPVVVKPSNQDQGKAVAPGIRDQDTLLAAFAEASKYSPGAVIVEKHIVGDDHRLLVVKDKLLMATKRIPAGVTGDGRLTVNQLMTQVNADPRRGSDTRSLLLRLVLDAEGLSCLAEQGLSPDSVPDIGQFVHVRRTANLSTGGLPEDVSSTVHPDNHDLALRTARVIGLDIAGIDFLCPDITRSWREVGGAICEVNAQPGFRVHWLGDASRDINAEVLAHLYPDNDLRIPTAAITGSNGKTIAARMLHHIWQSAGKVAGMCASNGVWVGDQVVTDQNLAGLPGARIVLNDPATEAAVLELPVEGLLQHGHPCDRYDVAALLNVQEDHPGVGGTRTLAQKARVNAEVLERTRDVVVLNAEDPLCLAMREHVVARRQVLVGRNASVPAIRLHLETGGDAVFMQLHHGQLWIILAEGARQTTLMPIHSIVATMSGSMPFNEINMLFAVALAWAQGIELDTIRQAMARFHISPEQKLRR